VAMFVNGSGQNEQSL